MRGSQQPLWRPAPAALVIDPCAAILAARLRSAARAARGRDSRRCPRRVGTRVRQSGRARSAAARLGLAERVCEARSDLGSSWRELEGPRRGAGRDVQRAVPREPRRPGVARDRLAHRARASAATTAAIPAGGAEARELRSTSAPIGSTMRVTRRSGRSTSTTWAGSAGGAPRPVAVMSVCPPRPERARRALRRRVVSSSESTSSSSSSGGAGRALAQQRRPRPSSSERTARRCSPCEPKRRRSRLAGERSRRRRGAARARSCRARGRGAGAPRAPPAVGGSAS